MSTVYQLQVPLSASVIALGWGVFVYFRDLIDEEFGPLWAGREAIELEYRHHGDWPGGGIVTTFRVTRDRGTK
jgi:hypothetical protein